MNNNLALSTKLKTFFWTFLPVIIIIELILWITISTLFANMLAELSDIVTIAAIVAFVFATFTILIMLALEVYGTNLKHTDSRIACIVIHFIRFWIFICVSVISVPHYHYNYHYDYYSTQLMAISIIFTMWDFFRIISEFKIMSLIKKEENEDNSIETTTKVDAVSPLKLMAQNKIVEKINKLCSFSKPEQDQFQEMERYVLPFVILLELGLWIIFSTYLGFMISWIHGFALQNAAILSLIFATFTTLTMLGLEVNGTIKKHTESIYLSIVIRSIQMFIYICVAIGSGWEWYGYWFAYRNGVKSFLYQNGQLMAFSIFFIFWDIFRIILKFKIISLIKWRKNDDNTILDI